MRVMIAEDSALPREGLVEPHTDDAVVTPIQAHATDDPPHHPATGHLPGPSHHTAALDGHLTIHSPPGGPTLITAELPCAS
ncbi:hypothetical protein AB0D37_21370 [Streptomyces sp. NPDC048384]|uniref:hypothetical protein n=1 Tax=Streptomyces sp. NPDC048384 TaxID=3155487 RepID=UPI003420870E